MNSNKPTIPEVLPLIQDYYAKPGNEVGGSLHIVLEDPNTTDDDVRSCIQTAIANGDEEGEMLARLLLCMSRTQRRKLGHSNKYSKQKYHKEKAMSELALELIKLVIDQHETMTQLLEETPDRPHIKEIRERMGNIMVNAIKLKASLELKPRPRSVMEPEKIRTGDEINTRIAGLKKAWRELEEKKIESRHSVWEGWHSQLHVLFWMLGYTDRQAVNMANEVFGFDEVEWED